MWRERIAGAPGELGEGQREKQAVQFDCRPASACQVGSAGGDIPGGGAAHHDAVSDRDGVVPEPLDPSLPLRNRGDLVDDEIAGSVPKTGEKLVGRLKDVVRSRKSERESAAKKVILRGSTPERQRRSTVCLSTVLLPTLRGPRKE